MNQHLKVTIEVFEEEFSRGLLRLNYVSGLGIQTKNFNIYGVFRFSYIDRDTIAEGSEYFKCFKADHVKLFFLQFVVVEVKFD